MEVKIVSGSRVSANVSMPVNNEVVSLIAENTHKTEVGEVFIDSYVADMDDHLLRLKLFKIIDGKKVPASTSCASDRNLFDRHVEFNSSIIYNLISFKSPYSHDDSVIDIPLSMLKLKLNGEFKTVKIALRPLSAVEIKIFKQLKQA